MKVSTRSFIREARSRQGFSISDCLHGYIYARWPYLYIGVGTGEHPLTRLLLPIWNAFSRIARLERRSDAGSRGITFADTYHGKVVELGQAKRLVTLNREVDLRDLEQVIPYALARDIVIRNPKHIVALECPCRASRSNPCTPLDVCLIVGEPFAGFMVDHHPDRSRWISQEEAVEILTAEHDRGHVHHAFFKDAMLGRFYAICNCCSCCCGAMQAWQNGTPMLASSGYVSKVDPARCTGCGKCIDACHFGALQLIGGKARVDYEQCMGCGVCVSKCEHDAHFLVLAAGKGRPLEIHELIANNEKAGT